jgi:hypothetical protein
MFSASQLVRLHQSLVSTLQPVPNAIKFCWYGQYLRWQLTPPSLLEAGLRLSPMQPEISWPKSFLRFWGIFCRNLSLLFSDFAPEESQSGTTTLRTSGRKKEGVNGFRFIRKHVCQRPCTHYHLITTKTCSKLLTHEKGLSQHSFWLLLDDLYQHTYIHTRMHSMDS